MEVTTVQIATSLPVLNKPETDTAAFNREVSRATRSLNEQGIGGYGREFSFSIDPATKLAIVKLVNKETGEVVDQLPTDSVLQVARQIQELRSNNSRVVR